MAVEDRWRRLHAAMGSMEAAVNSPDPHGAPDAVAVALDALYDLWEAWNTARREAGLATNDRAVTGDQAGETTAALVYARGGKAHHRDLIEFGDLTDTLSDTFYDHYGAWRWGAYADDRYPRRAVWYAQHVSGQELLAPFAVAVAWLHAQPEVRRLDRA